MTENGLVTVLKDRLNQFTFEIVDEDLVANDITYTRYNSSNANWVTSPPERIRWIDTNGSETVLLSTDYSVNLASGYLVLNTAKSSSDTVRADYSFFPFTDAQLLAIVQSARKQVQVLTFRTIDPEDINNNYQEAILKKAYVLTIREMQFPTIKYFTISVGGRTIGKENQVAMINSMIESLEKEMLPDINAIRYFDCSNKLQ